MSKQLLIIEDDDAYANLLLKRLGRFGYQCLLAQDSSQALLCARRQRPTHVLLDMLLAQESSLTLINPLRQLLPNAVIVVLTGYASIATAVDAIRRGADNYLTKPAASEVIQAALAQKNAQIFVDHDTELMSTERLEWEHLQQVLAANEGNISATARQLGMHRRTLQRKLQKRPAKS